MSKDELEEVARRQAAGMRAMTLEEIAEAQRRGAEVGRAKNFWGN